MYKSLRPLYKFYILLFPLQLFPFLYTFKSFFSSDSAINNGFFIVVIGMIMIVLLTKGKIYYQSKDSLVYQSLIMIVRLLMLSVITSLILCIPFGTLYGENTLSASFSQNVYLILTGIAFYFNYTLFQTLDKREIEKLLDIMCICMILLGFIQLAVLLGIPGASTLYDQLDFFGILPDASFMTIMGRICLTASEPAGIGNIVGVLLLPYCLAQITYQKEKIKYILFSILLIAISFFSLSSTVYVCILVNLIMFIYLNSRGRNGIFFLMASACVIFVFGIIWYYKLSGTYVGQQISYYLTEKTVSDSDLSTTYRYSTVINDISCFIHYPLSGVGNGNQGFLYNNTMSSSYVSSAIRTNPQTVSVINGKAGVVSGGAFVPSFLSGYGLIGVLLLIGFIKKCIYKMNYIPNSMGCFKNLYFIGSVTFLAMTTVSGSLDCNFLAIFVCSLPLITDCENESYEENYE